MPARVLDPVPPAPAAARTSPVSAGAPPPRRAHRGRRAARALGAALLLLAAAGLPACSYKRHVTEAPRTATEQLLVTESVERAVEALALPGVAGSRAGVEVVGVSSGAEFHQDLPYLEAALAERLRREGATVVPAEEADRIVAVRVGTLSTTSAQSRFGLPSVPLIVGETPAIDFYRTLTQHGFTKLRVSQRDAAGRVLAEEEAVMERTRFKVYKILFLTFRSQRDIYPKGLDPG